MHIVDPGHIYEISLPRNLGTQQLIFVKRGGGAIQYAREWPGIQTQAVMRALIEHLKFEQVVPGVIQVFPLWQLGDTEYTPLTLGEIPQLREVIEVLIDRSQYLNAIIPCTETNDAIAWLQASIAALDELTPDLDDAADSISLALWCYEVRAWRRKYERVNRLLSAHDDDARPRPWRELPFDDVPFSAANIHERPIGPDGHIVFL